jgi:hypothetical protein
LAGVGAVVIVLSVTNDLSRIKALDEADIAYPGIDPVGHKGAGQRLEHH